MPPNTTPGESGSTSPLRRPQVSVSNELHVLYMHKSQRTWHPNSESCCPSRTTSLISKHFPSGDSNNLKSSPPDNTYLCLAVLDGVLCVIFLHGRSSPQTSPSATPCLMKSLSFEAQPEELEEHPLSPMHYARSGLGTAALNGRLIAAGWY